MTGHGPTPSASPGGRVPEFWYTLAIAPELRARHPELPLSLQEAAARGELQPEPKALAETAAAAEAAPEPFFEAFLEPEAEAEI